MAAFSVVAGLLFACMVGATDAHARVGALKRRHKRALWRLHTYCATHGFWPSAVDLYFRGRSFRGPVSLWRDLDHLRNLGLAQKVGGRQWSPTSAGYALLEVGPVVAKRKWRDLKWRLRDQKAIVETLDSAD